LDYRRALELAIRAARAAGEILRAEFHRPGGARGERGKAPADTEAEWAIRKILREAFPQWRYLGEETGEHVPNPQEPHCWLVDPNDGTTSYQRGYRGPAVSIAVVRGDTPVLGVLYSFAAPDDACDLLAWAEGCGAITRNGKAVTRAAWPEQLGRYDVVLVSRGADRHPRADAENLSPARFVTVPSIAYRLGLVAVGDGAAAVSLSAPGAWDYAAGHALLRAAGGDMVNERGEPVLYSSDGRSKTQFCFGGAPAVIRELARRDWTIVKKAAFDEPAEYDLVRPRPGEHIADAGLLARAQGCLLGQVAGDALGTGMEVSGSGRAQMVDGLFWNTIAGQPTDDSELALLLARTLATAGTFDAEQVARAYHFWLHSRPFDCGMTVTRALRGIAPANIEAGRAAEAAMRAANGESQANGALMRISPLGIWGHALPPDTLATHARADASLTHPHPVCRDASAAYVVAVAHAIATGAGPRETWRHAVDWAKAQGADDNVQCALRDAESQPPKDYTTWAAGWVLVALQNAFYQLLHAPNFEEGLVRTILAGGDTDTNGAIAGALLGSVHGRDVIPLHWRQMVQSCRPMEGLPGVALPRPRDVWPVDAMILAERLLWKGKEIAK
jgi:ADP-ribosylglycohydrolase/fructose-1,6-bisphosphatase/inositol monophosphatase family enzyme